MKKFILFYFILCSFVFGQPTRPNNNNSTLSASNIDTQSEVYNIRSDLKGTFAADSNGNQANATLLNRERCYITSSGSGYAVKLPAASENVFVWVYNTSIYDILVFPNTDDDLGSGVNSSAIVPAGKTASFVATDSTDWLSVIQPKDIYLVYKSSAYTVGTDDPSELKGGIIFVTSTATITLPAISSEKYWFTVIPVGTSVATIDPNASDGVRLNGASSALTDGTAIVSSGTAGDMAVVISYDADSWMTMTFGFSSE